MKPLLCSLCLLLFIHCGCQPNDSAYQQRMKDWSIDIEKRLVAIERPNESADGRYQLVAMRDQSIFKIDTRTGDTWELARAPGTNSLTVWVIRDIEATPQDAVQPGTSFFIPTKPPLNSR